MVRDRQFYIDFFSMWIVLVLQNVITLSVNLADNMMLGAYSETALAGVAAVNQIQFVYQQLLISLFREEADGAGEKPGKERDVLWRGLVRGLVSGIQRDSASPDADLYGG